MAEQPKIQIDDDWKRQAQEEKRRLAEQAEKARSPELPPAGAATHAASATAKPQAAASRDPSRRDMPPASFAALVQSFMTQALLYLGELAVRGSEPVLNLDMARHQIDLLGILDEKTRGNLAADERKLLDSVLYDLRSRFVSVANQFIM